LRAAYDLRDVGINFLLNEYKAMSAANLYGCGNLCCLPRRRTLIPRKVMPFLGFSSKKKLASL